MSNQVSETRSLTLVLPSRDDVVHLTSILDQIMRIQLEFQIVLVDSGSRPANRATMEKIVATYRRHGLEIELVNSSVGLGRALSDGFEAAKHPTVGWFPTDGQLEVGLLEEMTVSAVRCSGLFVTRSEYRQAITFSRRLLTHWNRHLTRWTLGIRNYDFSGAFIVPTSIVRGLPTTFRTAALNWAVLHRFIASGLDVTELVANVRRRDVGNSRISNSEKLRYPFELIRYAIWHYVSRKRI